MVVGETGGKLRAHSGLLIVILNQITDIAAIQ